MHGAEMCHAYGCRKHSKLYIYGRGLFCKRHVTELKIIRSDVARAKVSGDKQAEKDARQREVEFRKFCDAAHMHYLLCLEKNLQLQ